MGAVKRVDDQGDGFEVVSTRRSSGSVDDTEIAIRQVRRLKGEDGDSLELAVKGAPDYQVSSTRKLKEGYYEVVLSKPKKKKKKERETLPQVTSPHVVAHNEAPVVVERKPETGPTARAEAPRDGEVPVGRAWRERAQRRTSQPPAPPTTSLVETSDTAAPKPGGRDVPSVPVSASHFDAPPSAPSVVGRPMASGTTDSGPISLASTPDEHVVKSPKAPVVDLLADEPDTEPFDHRRKGASRRSALRVDSLFEEFEATVRKAAQSESGTIVAAPRTDPAPPETPRKKKKARRSPEVHEVPEDLGLDGSQQPQHKTALDRTLDAVHPPVVNELHEAGNGDEANAPPVVSPPKLSLVVSNDEPEAVEPVVTPVSSDAAADLWIDDEPDEGTASAGDEDAPPIDFGADDPIGEPDAEASFEGFGSDSETPDDSAATSEGTEISPQPPSVTLNADPPSAEPLNPPADVEAIHVRSGAKFASRDDMVIVDRTPNVEVQPVAPQPDSAKKKFASRDDMPERPTSSAPLPPPPVAPAPRVAAGAMAPKPPLGAEPKGDKKSKPPKPPRRRPFSRAPKGETASTPGSPVVSSQGEKQDKKAAAQASKDATKRRPFSRAPKESNAVVGATPAPAKKQRQRPFTRPPKEVTPEASKLPPPPKKQRQRPFSRKSPDIAASVTPHVQGSVRPPPADLRPRVQIDPRTGRPVEDTTAVSVVDEKVVTDDGSVSEVILKDPGRRRRGSKDDEASTAQPRPSNEFLDHLVAKGQFTDAQLDAAWERSAKTERTLFEGLVDSKVIGEDELVDAVAAFYELPVCDLPKEEVEPDALDLVPEQIAREHMAFPITVSASGLLVAVAEPSERLAGLLAQASGHTIYMTIAKSTDIRWAIDTNYHALTGVAELVQEFEAEESPRRREQKTAANEQADENAPIVQVVNRILSQAMRDGASDVHIEPADDIVRVRNRVDGVLKVVLVLPAAMGLGLVSRIKIMAEMNIVERRRPQDGKFTARIDNRDIDVRVATVATIWGETCVMRILDKTRSVLGIADLGMAPDTHANYSRLIRAPFGMVLCVGPTGSGKTTTLYASLTEISDVARNVMTIEDPVEYVFPSINQIQTNEQAGLTFATGLKSILRQDSDVVLVGEIRDVETARIAVQSTLTGHFVLSSLHATDAISALTRFIDMGIESFLIASSVIAIVGQRLVRQICQYCKEPYVPSDEEMAFYTKGGGPAKEVFYHGAGCNFCGHSGYKDRIGVYELFQITPEVKRLIVGFATEDELRDLARKQGMRTLQDEAIAMVANDQTTSAEVVRSIYSL